MLSPGLWYCAERNVPGWRLWFRAVNKNRFLLLFITLAVFLLRIFQLWTAKKSRFVGVGKRMGAWRTCWEFPSNRWIYSGPQQLRTASPHVCHSQDFAGTAKLHYGSCRFLLAFFSCFVLAADNRFQLLLGTEMQRTWICLWCQMLQGLCPW